MNEKMQIALKKLEELQKQSLAGGNQAMIDRHVAKGKMLPRDRISALVDPGTFVEIGSAARATSERIDGKKLPVEESPCDGAITGYGRVNDRPVAIYASDFSVLAGSLGQQHIVKMVKIIEYAGQYRMPVVWLLDSAGGRLGWEDVAIAGVEWFFWPEGLFSGVVPQITVLMGPCIAGQAYAPCMTDFLFMTRKTAHLWLGGPRMTQAATSEKMDDDVGSGDYHERHSGTCDKVGENDAETISFARQLMDYLPLSFADTTIPRTTQDPRDRKTPELMTIVPDDFDLTYDVRQVIECLADDAQYFEIREQYARQICTAFAHIDGQPVGIVACNPAFPGSIVTRDACDKYYRFLQVLDAYNIPLITLVDTPPTLPDEQEESLGVLRHVAKMTHLYAGCTIPKIAVILRQACGDAGGIILGANKGMGVDMNVAWPIAEFSITASRFNPCTIQELGVDSAEWARVSEASRESVDAFEAAHTPTTQLVDEIIHPENTRSRLADSLWLLKNKSEELPAKAKKHGAPPT